jgi:hypothetical protein
LAGKVPARAPPRKVKFSIPANAMTRLEDHSERGFAFMLRSDNQTASRRRLLWDAAKFLKAYPLAGRVCFSILVFNTSY